jgi:acetyl-CoA carboxylase biotin carboxylase subunit
MEFLLEDTGQLRFMEMNTRLQVEHPVTELRTGVDLVVEQLRVAAGAPLAFKQQDVRFDGHAIECRINAEDPSQDFRPSPGKLTVWRPPAESDRVRIDTHISEGSVVPPHYDSLICKVIAKGPDRDAACDTLVEALTALKVEGVHTTVPMHLAILQSAEFRSGRYDTRSIPGWPPAS